MKAAVVSNIRRGRTAAYGSDNAWRQLCAAVKLRDGHRCRQCSSTVNLEVHHIIPVSRGGQTAMFNLKTLCEACHRRQPFHSHLQKRGVKWP